jgi:hypothetical protein
VIAVSQFLRLVHAAGDVRAVVRTRVPELGSFDRLVSDHFSRPTREWPQLPTPDTDPDPGPVLGYPRKGWPFKG